MDTSDPDIEFDEQGRCNHCIAFQAQRGTLWFDDSSGLPRLDALIGAIKEAGRGREYDCLIGLSGGADSSYVAMRAHDWGLRPLLVHVDAGWNSEVAVHNIERIVRYTRFDLHTEVIHWPTMRRLQLAYLRSGIPNQDVPQDHAFFATLYKFAVVHGVHSIVNGFNFASEGIFPSSWQGAAMDRRNLRAIAATQGVELSGFPTIGMLRYYVWNPFVRRVRPLNPLNLMQYDKEVAKQEMAERIGWTPYGYKHGESTFTRWFQCYYLPIRFGYDKRKPHLSSLVAAGQLSREDALEELRRPLYDAVELEVDTDYVARKLELPRTELDALVHQIPLARHRDYPNWDKSYAQLKEVQGRLERLTGRRLGAYRGN